MKSDTNICICGDYKVTINQASQTDSYPLPRADDLFAALSGGTIFTKLDLSHAYQQILLDDDFKKIYDDRHTQRIVSVSEIIFCHFHCTSLVSMYHGKSSPRTIKSMCLY